MEFKELCCSFEEVKKVKKIDQKRKILEDCFNAYRGKHSKESMFQVLRLIVPNMDRERPSYCMQERKIIRILMKMLGLPREYELKVHSKSSFMANQGADYGDVVYSVIRKYILQYTTTLTIQDLNNSLDNIAKRKNEAEVEDIIMNLFKKCSAEDSRWIIRIILKDLKLGIGENQILNCYHQEGAPYYSSNTNLRKVCETLYDKNVNVHELDIQIFEPFRPMLAKRVDAGVFKKHLINSKLFYIENKFDGERFQLHMKNGVFKYFSRNGFDYTDTYGATFDDENGILTPKLKDIFPPFVQKIMIDGEMMLWNRYTKKYGSKGMELDVKKLKKGGKYQPCFCAYDILMLNDEILTNRPLKDRLLILNEVFKDPISGTIIVSDVTEVSTPKEIVNELNMAVDKEEEGIMVKDPNTVYKYSDRNSGWFKLKLEYFQDTMNDLDLIVMGGQFASSTSDQLNSFILGVQSGRTESGRPLFLSFGKVSSGLNDEQLENLNKKLKSDGKLFRNQHSSALVFGKEVPDYYIEPENSVVFVVRASELTRTNGSSYKTPYTLRFPRVLKVRTDKPVDECLNMNELLELTNKNNSVIKLNKRYIQLEEIFKIKTRETKRRKIEVIEFENTKQISDLLEGYLFYVLNCNQDQVEALIQRAGGKVHYKVDNSVDVVLVGDYNAKIMELCKKRQHYDVIDIAWLHRVTKEGNLLPYETLEVYCLGTNIKNCLSDAMDRYGDSFTEDATLESLKHSLELVQNLNEEPCFSQLIEIPQRKSFESHKAYFDKLSIIGEETLATRYDSLEDELEFKYYYGEVCQSIEPETDLIITNDPKRVNYITEYLKSINRGDIKVRNRSFLYN